MDRRRFFRHVGRAGLGAAAFGPVSAAPAHPHPIADGASWEDIRESFEVTRHIAYLNCATFGPSPDPVIDALVDEQRVAEGHGRYWSRHDAVSALAGFLGAAPEELTLTRCTTEGVNVVAWGLDLRPGDEIVLTTHEHAGGALPWISRSLREGLVLRPFEPGPTAAINGERIEALIGPRTRVVALPHITTTTGLVMPLERIAALCRARGLFFFVDGAHGPGSRPVDLHGLGVDAYAACGHKWMLGPAGTGFLFVRKEHTADVRMSFSGAGAATDWKLNRSGFSLVAAPGGSRHAWGTRHAPLDAGWSAAIEFLSAVGMERAGRRIAELQDRLASALLDRRDRFELLRSPEKASQGPHLCFRPLPPLPDYEETVRLAHQAGYRLRKLPEAGLHAVRVSTHIFNSEDEIDGLVDFLDDLR